MERDAPLLPCGFLPLYAFVTLFSADDMSVVCCISSGEASCLSSEYSWKRREAQRKALSSLLFRAYDTPLWCHTQAVPSSPQLAKRYTEPCPWQSLLTNNSINQVRDNILFDETSFRCVSCCPRGDERRSQRWLGERAESRKHILRTIRLVSTRQCHRHLR